MPHVSDNFAYARGCLRKRPFNSEEEALSLNPDDFQAYLCRFCHKWHRTAKQHLKEELQRRKKRNKAYRKAKALRKRALIRQFYEH
jgi:hypothetical protein